MSHLCFYYCILRTEEFLLSLLFRRFLLGNLGILSLLHRRSILTKWVINSLISRRCLGFKFHQFISFSRRIMFSIVLVLDIRRNVRNFVKCPLFIFLKIYHFGFHVFRLLFLCVGKSFSLTNFQCLFFCPFLTQRNVFLAKRFWNMFRLSFNTNSRFVPTAYAFFVTVDHTTDQNNKYQSSQSNKYSNQGIRVIVLLWCRSLYNRFNYWWWRWVVI